jgi:glycosyltransferase involved in cell wall biosynthesis
MDTADDINFPKITIITVTRNLIASGRKEFFLQCLESVQNQTYPNIEHIVIDGASTDGTLELLEEYKRKKWITYYSQPDEGVYDAMNKGIQKSTGKYVNFLNSDDYFCDNIGLERSVELLEKTGAAFSHSEVCNCNANGEKLHLQQNRVEYFFFRMPFCHQGVLMRRDILVFEGMFNNTDFKIASDYDLLIRVILNGYRGVSVNVVFAVFRIGGLSHIMRQTNDECIKIWKKYFPRMNVVMKYDDEGTHLLHFIAMDQLNNIMSHVNEEISKKIAKIKMKKCSGGMLQITGCASYAGFLKKTYRLFGIIPFATRQLLQWEKLMNTEFTKIWTIFGIRIFRIKKTKNYRIYYFFYIPVLAIANR